MAGTTTLARVPKIGTMSLPAGPDWYLREWLATLGKRQASLTIELGWNKNTAHLLFHSKQPYRREDVNEISAWLQIRPYELLMPPEEAMAIRRLRESAARIVGCRAESCRARRTARKSSPKVSFER